jgi:hypothetical protein
MRGDQDPVSFLQHLDRLRGLLVEHVRIRLHGVAPSQWLRRDRGRRRPPLNVLVERVQELVDLAAAERGVCLTQEADALGLRHRARVSHSVTETSLSTVCPW